MFTVTLMRKDTDGDVVQDEHEGVVDVKTMLNVPKLQLTFNDGRTETVPYGELHIESPMK